MNKPQLLSDEEWTRLTDSLKYRYNNTNKKLTYDQWQNLDGLTKVSMLKHINIDLNRFSVISKNLYPRYPQDIYLYSEKKKYVLPESLLAKIKSYTNYDHEVAGIISYDDNKTIKDKIIFEGDFNRVNLNIGKDSETLYHTHPYESRPFEPPSVLDIISYLANVIKFIADTIIDSNHGIEHPLDDPLVYQNSMVFSREGVYVYYISYPLIEEIVRRLAFILKDNDVNNFTRFIEEIELAYSNELSRFNKYYWNGSDVNEYLLHLNNLGIIIRYFPYTNKPESYIL